MKTAGLILPLSSGLLLALLMTPGCGAKPTDQPDLGLVSGVVLLDGQPLPMADIQFQPESGRPSTAVTDETGHYILSYTVKTPGAKTGNHQVRITTYRPNIDANDPGSPEYVERLPAKYHSKSELTAVVKSGKNDIPFDLKSK